MSLFNIPSTIEVLSAVFAFVFCGLIGLERQLRHKSAGVRTHILVGLGACLFTMVSLYGAPNTVNSLLEWDASRIAAQIVSGVGFLGGGLIFVQRDAVRGLTTAASVWVTAAIGMACGAAMFMVALMVLVLHFVAILLAPYIASLRHSRDGEVVELTYEDGRGVLREALLLATEHGFKARILSSHSIRHGEWRGVELLMQLQGRAGVPPLLAELTQLGGVATANIADDME